MENNKSKKVLDLYLLHKKMTDILSSPPNISTPSDFSKVYTWFENLVGVSKKIDNKK